MENKKIIAKNPVAYFNFNIIDTFETGIILTGREIKSIRQGKVNIKNSYANIKNGECFVYDMYISPLECANIKQEDPKTPRKLLLTKKEINYLKVRQKQDKLSLVVISLYFKRNLIKVELGLGQGKKLYDKRESEKKKDAEIKIKRALKEKNNN